MTALRDIQVFGPPGTRIVVKGREYEIVRFEPYTRKDGSLTALSVWIGECAECGASFEHRTTAGRLQENRRCQEHKSPGRRMAGTTVPA